MDTETIPPTTPVIEPRKNYSKIVSIIAMLVLLVTVSTVSFLFGKNMSNSSNEEANASITPTIYIVPSPTEKLLKEECKFHSLESSESTGREANFEGTQKTVYCGDATAENKELLNSVFDSLWKNKPAQGGPTLTLIIHEGDFAGGKEYAGGGYGFWFGVNSAGKWKFEQVYEDECGYISENKFPTSFKSSFNCK